MMKSGNTKITKTFVLLSLGSNFSKRRTNIIKAYDFLKYAGILSGLRLSSFYETEPVGVTDQNWFINVAVSGKTDLDIGMLLQMCKSIEYAIGRELRGKWREREIDIDVLLYGDTILDKPSIKIPHPRMQERRFVLEPASEIAGSEIHPVSGHSIDQLLADCPDKSKVSII